MVKGLQMVRTTMFALAGISIVIAIIAPFAFAQHQPDGVAAPGAPVDLAAGIKAAGLALGAGIALAGGAIGTGIVQSAVCAGGVGVLAEKRDMLGLVMILLAFPETLVILGFVLGIMLIGRI